MRETNLTIYRQPLSDLINPPQVEHSDWLALAVLVGLGFAQVNEVQLPAFLFSIKIGIRCIHSTSNFGFYLSSITRSLPEIEFS
jgi:hypothetical protein